MHRKLINRIFSALIVLIIISGIAFNNARLYIYGKGIENEDELTFGLSNFLNLESVTFYEMNLLFSSLVFSAILLLTLKLAKYHMPNDKIFHSIMLIYIIAISITTGVLIYNFESIETVHPGNKNYTNRFFENLDDLIVTNRRIKIRLDESAFRMCCYSLVLFLFSAVGMVIRLIFPIKKTRVEQIDHFIEN